MGRDFEFANAAAALESDMVAFMARYGFTMRQNHAETAERGGGTINELGD